MLEIYQPCTFTNWDISLFYKIAVDIQVEKKMRRNRFYSGSSMRDNARRRDIFKKQITLNLTCNMSTIGEGSLI